MCTITRVWLDCSKGTQGFLLLWSNLKPPALLPHVPQLRDVSATATRPLLLPNRGEMGTEPKPHPKAQSKDGDVLFTACSRERRLGQGHRAVPAPWAGPGGLFTVLPCAEGTPQGFTSFRENRLPGELSHNLPLGTGKTGREVGDRPLLAGFSLN